MDDFIDDMSHTQSHQGNVCIHFLHISIDPAPVALDFSHIITQQNSILLNVFTHERNYLFLNLSSHLEKNILWHGMHYTSIELYQLKILPYCSLHNIYLYVVFDLVNVYSCSVLITLGGTAVNIHCVAGHRLYHLEFVTAVSMWKTQHQLKFKCMQWTNTWTLQ